MVCPPANISDIPVHLFLDSILDAAIQRGVLQTGACSPVSIRIIVENGAQLGTLHSIMVQGCVEDDMFHPHVVRKGECSMSTVMAM